MVRSHFLRPGWMHRNRSISNPLGGNGAAHPLSLILAALDQAKEAYLVMTPDSEAEPGRITYVNRAFCELTGYQLAEIQGKAPSLFYSRETAEILREHVRESLEETDHFLRDILLFQKDGSEVWAELQIVPVSVPPHIPTHWVGILRDISERKLTEQSLLESQMRLNGILNSLSDVVWSINVAKDRFIYLSPSTEAIFGRPVDDFYHNAKLWTSMIHPEDREAVVEAMRVGLARGSFEIDYRITRDDGDIRWLRNRGRVVFDLSGKPVHYDGIADDITANKVAELRMERMAAFPRFNPNPVYEIGADGQVSYSNQAALKLAQSLGFDDPSAILPSDLKHTVIECLLSGEPRLRREEVYGERTISWSFFPIQETRRVHCYAGEITDRLRLESQLRQSEKLKSIGQLAGGVAHDFNNILTVIHGFTNLLLTQEHKDPTVVDQLNQIAVAAERARDLTKQLLMFSRRQVMKPITLDLNKIIRDLAKMLVRLLGEQTELKVACSEEPFLVEGDRSMLEQIILNLVANARDAMAPGGCVTLRTELIEIKGGTGEPLHPEAYPGHFIRLTSQDTGCGMDERTLTRIFEPFFTTKEMGKGTGLGLATVYGVVKQHKGWIQVESEVGVGTAFHVYLPLSAAHLSGGITAPVEAKALGGTETILVVEDEVAVRQLILTILRSAGYTVLEAGGGLDAIGVWEANRERIDLLLTDLVMPGLISGIDLGQKLAAEKPELKVIFSSGYSADVIGEDLTLDASTHFLAKPYQPQGLLKMVRECLDEKAAPAS